MSVSFFVRRFSVGHFLPWKSNTQISVTCLVMRPSLVASASWLLGRYRMRSATPLWIEFVGWTARWKFGSLNSAVRKAGKRNSIRALELNLAQGGQEGGKRNSILSSALNLIPRRPRSIIATFNS